MDHRHWARRPPRWLAHTVAAAEDAAALEHTRPLVSRLAGPLTRRAALRDVLAGVWMIVTMLRARALAARNSRPAHLPP